MQTKQEHINIITRYFSGEASAEEIQVISNLLISDFSFRKEFNEQKEIWESVGIASIKKNIDPDAEWIKFKNTLQKKETAIIPFNKKKNSGKTPFLLKIAAIFIFAAIATVLIYTITNPPAVKQVQVASLNTFLEKKLPDGTVVNLNIRSTLEYPESFADTRREVKLSGHAIFNVTHDKEKPFIVDAGYIFIEVVGTSFSVEMENNGEIRVIVSDGKVAVYKKVAPEEKIYLTRGEMATFTGIHVPITRSVNKDENFNAWQTRRLVFNDESLSGIIDRLNEVYNTRIIIENHDIASCRVTATFDNQSLEAVLKVLKATIDIRVTKTGDVIMVSGEGCR